MILAAEFRLLFLGFKVLGFHGRLQIPWHDFTYAGEGVRVLAATENDRCYKRWKDLQDGPLRCQ